MSGEHVRHARGKDDWGTQPGRSAQRAAAAVEPEKRAPGKKDRDLCKAAHWKGLHQPELRMKSYGWPRKGICLWAVSWRSKNGEPVWHCGHEEYCSGCGKALRASIGDSECPGFREITDADLARIEAERAESEVRVAAARTRNRWRPRPAITGPQGFRRKRED